MAARAGARVNVTRTKTGHRLTVLFYVGWEGGGKIMLDCGFSLPHQHTAAVTSGHPQQPVKEKHWTHCLIHRMFNNIIAIPLYPSCRDTCIDTDRSDQKNHYATDDLGCFGLYLEFQGALMAISHGDCQMSLALI